MSKAIVHLDADAFFASVEQATDTRLRGKPTAIGGEKRGVIASNSVGILIMVLDEKSGGFYWLLSCFFMGGL